METQEIMNPARVLAALAGAMIMNVVEPVLPYALLCTLAVLADVVTACSLARRVRRLNGKTVKVSSRRMGRAVVTLGKIYAQLVIAGMADWLLLEGTGWSAVRCAAGAVCLWQAVSVLENEASCSDARWAKIARKWLVDKAKRHLNAEG